MRADLIMAFFVIRKKLNRDAKAAEVQTMIGLHYPMPVDFQMKLAPLLQKYRVRCLGSGALTATYVATGYLSGSIDYR